MANKNRLLDLLGSDKTGLSGTDRTDLAQYATLLQLLNQNQLPQTMNIAGSNIPLRQPAINRIGPALQNLILGGALIQQGNKRQQFLKGIQTIIKSPKTQDEKINELMNISIQFPEMAKEMGILDIIKAYGEQMKLGTAEWKPTTKEEALEFEREKAGIKKGKTLIAPMIDKISKNENAYYTLNNSLEQLTANTDKFAQFMGPGKGALRSPFRSYVNKDLQDFLAWKANVQDAFQQYRVAVTGAQASDKEIALLAKNRPTENDTYDVFIKKTNEVRKIGNRVIKRYITNLSKAGYDVSGYEDTITSLDEEMKNLSKETEPLERNVIPENNINIQTPNIQEGQTATNPKTGQKIIYRGGRWQPMTQ